ncbi:MAG: hypothetical protein HZA12_02165 [Nitrospirae bacterium]|nr:hypothetical protein [Nitrospirota bacterium]
MRGIFTIKTMGVSILISLLIISLSGLTGLVSLAHAAITDLTPPIVRHSPPARIIQGEDMVIMAIVEDESDISWVNLWYRTSGKDSYRKLLMKQVDLRKYEARVKVTEDFRKGIEYYIEAVDQFGNEGTDGNKGVPYFAEVKERPVINVMTPETGTKEQTIGTSSGGSALKWLVLGILVIGGGIAAASGGGGSSGGGSSTGTIIVK